MNFNVDKTKAVEAIVYVASQMPGIGRFHASKALYFAELNHLRTYGRPIFGDRYIAMDNGPVPSFAYNVLKGTVSPADAALIDGALNEKTVWHHPEYEAARKPDLTLFSDSDIECLDAGIARIKNRTFGSISDETHQHPGWKNAEPNSPMKFDDMLEGAEPDVIASAEEFAAYGVL